MSNAPTKVLDAISHATGHRAEPTPSGWQCRCPAHEDTTPSLSVSLGNEGRVLLKCHAGCSADAICKAAGLILADLMPSTGPRHSTNGEPRIVATYDYCDEVGGVLFQVCRLEPKSFRQRRPDGKGGWNWSVKGVRRVPYRLPELLAEPSRVVFIVEGEKDADRLADLGLIATTSAGGAGKWKPEFAEHFRGRTVAILPDNDEPGRQHARQVARSLTNVAKLVCIVELPDLPEKGDLSDWLAAGGTKDRLRELVESAPDWRPEAAPQEWPMIDSLDDRHLPDFPTEALPDVLRLWVEEESHFTQTPPDMAGLLALAVCSSTIARRVEVEARPGWLEPVNLFVAVLLDPANRKSAVFADAIKPLREIEAELIEVARPDMAFLESTRRQKEAQLKRLEKMAAEGDNHAAHEAFQLAAELATAEEHVLPRLIVDDATAEKLGIILAEQGGRIARLSPEGGVFDLMAGQYSKSGIPQFGVYLMGHSGDDLLTDRVGRKSVSVKRPALTCGYAMQPAVIAGLAERTAFRGRGLLARFLYAAPRSWIGTRQIAPPPVSASTREAYRGLIRTLAETEGETVLTLSADAQSLLMDWEADIERRLADGGDLEMMKDWGGKLAGATLRLAAVIHCGKHRAPIGQIDVATLSAAIELGKYLIPHAEATLDLMAAKEDSTDDDARYVLAWIKRHGKRTFTKTEAQQHGKRRFPKADDIDNAFATLMARNYVRLRPTPTTGPGRPPSPTYETNPAVFDSEPAQNRSGYSKNPPPSGSSANSQNIQSAIEPSEKPNRTQVTI